MKKILKLFIVTLILLYSSVNDSLAQRRRAVAEYDVTITVETIANEPIAFAELYANHGMKKFVTGLDGIARLQGVNAGEILIEATGYENVTFSYSGEAELSVSLVKAGVFAGQKDLIHLPYASLPQKQVVGAVSVIQNEDLDYSNEINLSNALIGKAAGLYAFKRPGEPGNYSISLRVRGQSRGGSGDGPLVVVNGVPNRSMDNLLPSEIESIQILKDPTSKLMYGASAADGVIMVTTKKGDANKKVAKISADYGIKTPTILPEFLNAYEYAQLYNEARVNDGMPELYNQTQLDGYRQGTNHILYPDVDYYNTFLKSQSNYQRLNALYSGGSTDTRYLLNLGYVGEDGLESIGNGTQYNKMNLRANLDYIVNDYISADFSFAGSFEFWNSHNMSGSQFFSHLSSHRPNEYPLYFSMHPVQDSIMLGYSAITPVNLYGELTQTGFTKSSRIAGQTDIGLKYNLGNIVKGLTASTRLSFDTYNFLSEGKTEEYPRFRADSTVVGTRVVQADLSRKGDDVFRDFQALGSLDYKQSFERSEITSNLVFTAIQRSRRGRDLDIKNTNLAYRLHYTLDSKYILEANASLMGSSKYMQGNRYGIFPAAGAAWIISEENFLRESSFVDFLKLKGSWGIIGYDNSVDFLLWKDSYDTGPGYNFGTNNSVSVSSLILQRIGNEDLTFEKSREINIGLEALILNKSLFMEVNYFNEFRYDMPAQASILYPDFYGGMIPTINFEEVKNHGIEIMANYTNKVGALAYSIGGNLTSSYAEYVTVDEINYYDWLNRAGTPTDAIRGYIYEGFYQNESEINAHGVISNVGLIRPGDLKYADLTGDNIIDNQDRQVIGNSFPRYYYAANIRLNYKGFGLVVVGQGVSGLDNMLSNFYYQNYAEGKYSVNALNRWTQTSGASSTHPRLTTSSAAHSYTNSAFWMTNGSYFKLRNVEISYTLSGKSNSNFFLKDAKIFARGADLFTISKIKEADPEFINAGLTDYPMFRTISFGIQLGL